MFYFHFPFMGIPDAADRYKLLIFYITDQTGFLKNQQRQNTSSNESMFCRWICAGSVLPMYQFNRLSKDKLITVSLPKEASCSEAIQILSKSTGNQKNLIDIIENGKPVDKDIQMQELSRVKAILFVVHPDVRPAHPNYVTNKPDIINDWDDDDRVEMSCGHAINPGTLYDYCWNQILSNKITFECPAIENGHLCGAEWEFPEVSLKACLSDDERILFETRLNFNWINKNSETGRCPTCMELCERQDSEKLSVQCFYCKKAGRKDYIFCWYCLMPWEDNHLCSIEGAESVLQTCALKAIGETEGCPSLRACPNCKSFIEHSEKCKKMNCQYCGYSFCFICLTPVINGNAQCGDENNPCIIASIQSFNEP